MEFIDDRTEDQKKTHTVLITARDKFLSGGGPTKGGYSYCAWAVRPEDANDMYNWVRDRSDMIYVNISNSKWKPRNKAAKHCHIYVADRGDHPALPGKRLSLIHI